MSEAKKPAAQQTDEERLPDLPVAKDEDVKGGLNFTKVEYKNIPMLG
jgi:hypothetical protein